MAHESRAEMVEQLRDVARRVRAIQETVDLSRADVDESPEWEMALALVSKSLDEAAETADSMSRNPALV